MKNIVFQNCLKTQLLFLFQGIVCLTVIFAAQLTLSFFSVSFHLRSHEDLREELVTKLTHLYNEPGGEFFTPALDYVQTRVRVI